MTTKKIESEQLIERWVVRRIVSGESTAALANTAFVYGNDLMRLVLDRADELKLVFPQAEPEAQPERWVDFPAGVRSLQPMDGSERAANTAAAVAYCLAHPEWRLSVQTHKDIGIP